jgi:hypothetical protein
MLDRSSEYATRTVVTPRDGELLQMWVMEELFLVYDWSLDGRYSRNETMLRGHSCLPNISHHFYMLMRRRVKADAQRRATRS